MTCAGVNLQTERQVLLALEGANPHMNRVRGDVFDGDCLSVCELTRAKT